MKAKEILRRKVKEFLPESEIVVEFSPIGKDAGRFYPPRTIVFNPYILSLLSKKQLEEIAAHEVAHYKVYSEHGSLKHNAAWLSEMGKMGVNSPKDCISLKRG